MFEAYSPPSDTENGFTVHFVPIDGALRVAFSAVARRRDPELGAKCA